MKEPKSITTTVVVIDFLAGKCLPVKTGSIKAGKRDAVSMKAKLPLPDEVFLHLLELS